MNYNYFNNQYNKNKDTIHERLSINQKNNIKKTEFKLLNDNKLGLKMNYQITMKQQNNYLDVNYFIY